MKKDGFLILDLAGSNLTQHRTTKVNKCDPFICQFFVVNPQAIR